MMRPNLAAHHAAMFNLYIVFMLLLFFEPPSCPDGSYYTLAN